MDGRTRAWTSGQQTNRRFIVTLVRDNEKKIVQKKKKTVERFIKVDDL